MSTFQEVALCGYGKGGLWLGVNFVVMLDYFSVKHGHLFLVVALPDWNTTTLCVLFTLADLCFFALRQLDVLRANGGHAAVLR